MILTIIFLLSIILFILIFYYIYNKRNLPKSLISLLCFIINCSIILLFSISFIGYLLFINKPVYLNDLSTFSQYKYLSFTITVIIGSLFIIITRIYKTKNTDRILAIFTHPYLNVQMNEILDSFVEPYLADFYEMIFEKTYKSRLFEIVFFVLHFFVVYGIPLLNTLIFLNFTLFNGDLTTLLLLTPLTLISFLTKYLEFNFMEYMERSSLESKKLFEISLKNIDSTTSNYITILPINVSISITAYGYSKNLSDDYIFEYKDKWILLVNFKYKFNLYKTRYNHINKINFLLRLYCWMIISIYFFK